MVGFSAGTTEQFSTEAKRALERAEAYEHKIQASIVDARSILPRVKIDSNQILYICEEATRAGCEGQRAEIFATEIAKASAAVSLFKRYRYMSSVGVPCHLCQFLRHSLAHYI